ncbi:MAG: hypothetical protein F6K09_26000 [Merismopedia sp. SIO2A8]|nr:hypothetical protein [Symploca sp. SIO2B6]NET52023.1 hypothetical protein [Merismopedia sp. SIO2A8]
MLRATPKSSDDRPSGSRHNQPGQWFLSWFLLINECCSGDDFPGNMVFLF